MNQLADGLTSGATEMGNGAAEMGSGATEMGTATTTMGAVAGQLPTDMISQLSAVTQQLYAECNSCKYRNKNCFRRTSETGDWYRSFPKAAAGIKALNDGFDKLTANNKKLTDGATSLKKQENRSQAHFRR